jgi:hypothetical protein
LNIKTVFQAIYTNFSNRKVLHIQFSETQNFVEKIIKNKKTKLEHIFLIDLENKRLEMNFQAITLKIKRMKQKIWKQKLGSDSKIKKSE